MIRPTQGDRSVDAPADSPVDSPVADGSRSVTTTRSQRPASDGPPARGRSRRSRAGQPGDGQPLAASWEPRPEPVARRRGRRRGSLSGVVTTYGWRVYALPVLVVLTALALFDSARSPIPELSWPGAVQGRQSTSGPALPLIPNPDGGAGFAAAKAPAELPGGGPFTKQGAGTWSVVPGAGAPFGTGQAVTYTVEVEDGVELPGGPAGFATTVDATLQNPKSWIGSGHYAFQRIDDPVAADIRITLSSQQTQRAICGFSIPFDASCWKGEFNQVVLNTSRWARGAVAFQGNLVEYQQYLVNHEVGHGLGFPHVGCQQTGQLAPVMMQQTWGLSNDYLAALGTDQVVADGKVCKPNAWPFPTLN